MNTPIDAELIAMANAESKKTMALMGHLDFSVQVEVMQTMLVDKAKEYNLIKTMPAKIGWNVNLSNDSIDCLTLLYATKVKRLRTLKIVNAAPTRQWKAKIVAWCILCERFLIAIAAGVKGPSELKMSEPTETCGDPQ